MSIHWNKILVRYFFLLGSITLFIGSFSDAQVQPIILPHAVNILGQYDIEGKIDFTRSNTNAVYLDNIGLNKPRSVEIDPINDRLYVADFFNNRILVYELDTGHQLIDTEADYVLGQPDFTYNTPRTTQRGMVGPFNMEYDTINDRLFVAEGGYRNFGNFVNARVLVFENMSDISNYKAASYVIGQPDFNTQNQGLNGSFSQNQFNAHTLDIAYDESGSRLFVATDSPSRILVFDLSGGISNGMNASWVLGQSNFTGSTDGVAAAGAVGDIRGLAYDEQNERLFAADDTYDRVLVFDLSGGITNGMDASRVLGQSSFGTGIGHATTQSRFRNPQGVGYNTDVEWLLVSDNGNRRTLIFDLSGGITNGMNASRVLGQSSFGSRNIGLSANSFQANPRNMGIYDHTSQQLFVSDWNNSRILGFDLSGGISNGMNASRVLGQTDTGGNMVFDQALQNNTGQNPSLKGLSGPQGFDIDTGNHLLFIADGGHGRVIVHQLDTTNDLIDDIPDYVLGQTGFTYQNPTGGTGITTDVRSVSYDAINKRLFVADANGGRILVFDLSGGISNGMDASRVLGEDDFTDLTRELGQNKLNRMSSIKYSPADQKLFVGEFGNSRVVIFDLSGGISNGMNASRVLGEPDFNTARTTDVTASGMTVPNVAYDEDRDWLFVGDFNYHRVLVFDLSGGISNGMNASRVIGQPDFTSSEASTTSSGFNTPRDIYYDKQNQWLFVSDGNNNRIMIFDTSSGVSNGMEASYVIGQPNFTSSIGGTSTSKINGPISVLFEPENRKLFIAEFHNQRVSIFDLGYGGSGAYDTITAEYIGCSIYNKRSFLYSYNNSLCIDPQIIRPAINIGEIIEVPIRYRNRGQSALPAQSVNYLGNRDISSLDTGETTDVTINIKAFKSQSNDVWIVEE